MPHRYVARKMVKFWEFLARHNTSTTLAVVAIVAIPGYLTLQAQANENSRQGDCNTQAWALLAGVVTADNGPWAATHTVLSQQADEKDYRALRRAVDARAALSDNFAAQIKAAARECGEPLPLPLDIPPVLKSPTPTLGPGQQD